MATLTKEEKQQLEMANRRRNMSPDPYQYRELVGADRIKDEPLQGISQEDLDKVNVYDATSPTLQQQSNVANALSEEVNSGRNFVSPSMFETIETRPLNGELDLGDSSYDPQGLSGALTSEDIQNQRADNQSGITQLGIGLLRGTATAAQTVVNTFAGLPAGLFEMGLAEISDDYTIETSGGSAFWNNAVTRTLDDLKTNLNEAIPIYESTAAQNENWYEKFDRASFWADMIDNAGFMVGSAMSGGVTASALGKLGGVGKFLNFTVASMSEAGVEAIEKYKTAFNQYTNLVDEQYTPQIQTLDSQIAMINRRLAELEKYVNNPDNVFGVLPETQAEYDKLMRQKQELCADRNSLAYQRDIDMDKYNKEALMAGNLTWCLNTALLTGTSYFGLNDIVFRNFNEAKLVGSITGQPGKYTPNLLSKARPFVAMLDEAGQEVGQGIIGSTAIDYYNASARNKYMADNNIDNIQETASWLNSLGSGLNEISSIKSEAWNEALGVVIPMLLGIPGLKRKTGKDGEDKTGFGWNGGLYNEFKEINEHNAEVTRLANQLNEIYNNPTTKSLIEGFIRDKSYEDAMIEALKHGDEFFYKNEEAVKMINAIYTFNKVGKLNDFMTLVNSINTNDQKQLEDLVLNGLQIVDDKIVGQFSNCASKTVDGQLKVDLSDPEKRRKVKDEIDKNIKKFKDRADTLLKNRNFYQRLFSANPNATEDRLDELAFMASMRDDANERIRSIQNDEDYIYVLDGLIAQQKEELEKSNDILSKHNDNIANGRPGYSDDFIDKLRKNISNVESNIETFTKAKKGAINLLDDSAKEAISKEIDNQTKEAIEKINKDESISEKKKKKIISNIKKQAEEAKKGIIFSKEMAENIDKFIEDNIRDEEKKASLHSKVADLERLAGRAEILEEKIREYQKDFSSMQKEEKEIKEERENKNVKTAEEVSNMSVPEIIEAQKNGIVPPNLDDISRDNVPSDVVEKLENLSKGVDDYNVALSSIYLNDHEAPQPDMSFSYMKDVVPYARERAKRIVKESIEKSDNGLEEAFNKDNQVITEGIKWTQADEDHFRRKLNIPEGQEVDPFIKEMFKQNVDMYIDYYIEKAKNSIKLKQEKGSVKKTESTQNTPQQVGSQVQPARSEGQEEPTGTNAPIPPAPATQASPVSSNTIQYINSDWENEKNLSMDETETDKNDTKSYEGTYVKNNDKEYPIINQTHEYLYSDLAKRTSEWKGTAADKTAVDAVFDYFDNLKSQGKGPFVVCKNFNGINSDDEVELFIDAKLCKDAKRPIVLMRHKKSGEIIGDVPYNKLTTDLSWLNKKAKELSDANEEGLFDIKASGKTITTTISNVRSGSFEKSNNGVYIDEVFSDVSSEDSNNSVFNQNAFEKAGIAIITKDHDVVYGGNSALLLKRNFVEKKPIGSVYLLMPTGIDNRVVPFAVHTPLFKNGEDYCSYITDKISKLIDNIFENPNGFVNDLHKYVIIKDCFLTLNDNGTISLSIKGKSDTNIFNREGNRAITKDNLDEAKKEILNVLSGCSINVSKDLIHDKEYRNEIAKIASVHIAKGQYKCKNNYVVLNDMLYDETNDTVAIEQAPELNEFDDAVSEQGEISLTGKLDGYKVYYTTKSNKQNWIAFDRDGTQVGNDRLYLKNQILAAAFVKEYYPDAKTDDKVDTPFGKFDVKTGHIVGVNGTESAPAFYENWLEFYLERKEDYDKSYKENVGVQYDGITDINTANGSFKKDYSYLSNTEIGRTRQFEHTFEDGSKKLFESVLQAITYIKARKASDREAMSKILDTIDINELIDLGSKFNNAISEEDKNDLEVTLLKESLEQNDAAKNAFIANNITDATDRNGNYDKVRGLLINNIKNTLLIIYKSIDQNKKHVKFDSKNHTYAIDGNVTDYTVTGFVHGKVEEEKDDVAGFLEISSAIGTSVDDVFRHDLNGVTHKSTVKESKTDHKNLSKDQVGTLNKISKDIAAELDRRFPKGYKVITDEDALRVYGVIDVNGEKKTIAGTMDMIVVDHNGNVHIFDFKTKRSNSHRDFWDNQKYEYSQQVFFYAKLYETMHPELRGKVFPENLLKVDTKYETPKGSREKETGETIYKERDGQIFVVTTEGEREIQSLETYSIENGISFIDLDGNAVIPPVYKYDSAFVSENADSQQSNESNIDLDSLPQEITLYNTDSKGRKIKCVYTKQLDKVHSHNVARYIINRGGFKDKYGYAIKEIALDDVNFIGVSYTNNPIDNNLELEDNFDILPDGFYEDVIVPTFGDLLGKNKSQQEENVTNNNDQSNRTEENDNSNESSTENSDNEAENNDSASEEETTQTQPQIETPVADLDRSDSNETHSESKTADELLSDFHLSYPSSNNNFDLSDIDVSQYQDQEYEEYDEDDQFMVQEGQQQNQDSAKIDDATKHKNVNTAINRFIEDKNGNITRTKGRKNDLSKDAREAFISNLNRIEKSNASDGNSGYIDRNILFVRLPNAIDMFAQGGNIGIGMYDSIMTLSDLFMSDVDRAIFQTNHTKGNNDIKENDLYSIAKLYVDYKRQNLETLTDDMVNVFKKLDDIINVLVANRDKARTLAEAIAKNYNLQNKPNDSYMTFMSDIQSRVQKEKGLSNDDLANVSDAEILNMFACL